jgi:hypothetical protein
MQHALRRATFTPERTTGFALKFEDMPIVTNRLARASLFSLLRELSLWIKSNGRLQ